MREILTGMALATIIFLAIIGVNVIPIIFILVMLGGLYFFMQSQGKIQFHKVRSTSNQVPISL